MIGYAMVGTNDLEKAKSFYDSVLAELGAKRTWGMDRLQAYAAGEDDTPLVVCRPHDGKAASFGNGTMIALRAPSRDIVEKVYKKALASGAKDEGPARRDLLRRLFPRPRRQQALRLQVGLTLRLGRCATGSG